MKIAIVHALPLEYYPPARNTIEMLAGQSGWEVRVWSNVGRRGMQPWKSSSAVLRRPWFPSPASTLPLRTAGYLAWHFRTAIELAAWRPDALLSIEPHSALAVWLYYHVFRGSAALFIHHHEYYSPADFDAPGMRSLRRVSMLERDDLYRRAAWVSETNEQRLRLLLKDSPAITRNAARSLPNYPPAEWISACERAGESPPTGLIRMVYVGAASFEDTFIREAAQWAAANAERVTLHICGDNIQPDVVTWVKSLDSRAVTINQSGVDYGELPSVLARFDVGLVLYRGNTLNFVHNVPNKAIEYLACGLQVWYPAVMKGMVSFHQQHPHEDLREVDFEKMPAPPEGLMRRQRTSPFPFTAEAALAPLIAELESIETRPG